MPAPQQNEFEHSALSLTSILTLLIAMALGMFGALIFAPSWMPNIAQTLVGTDPQAYWYLSRGSAFVALGLLWLSMMLGLLITNKVSRYWPGAAAAFAFHEYISLLGLAFAVFHALILLGDHYINYTVAQIFMPFGSVNYHPFWVGIGQIGFYVWAIVALTFYIRQLIGSKTWRFIHYLSFLMFLMAILHGVTSGTDASTSWAQTVYWLLGGSFLFLTILRIVVHVGTKLSKPAPRPVVRPQAPVVSAPIAAVKENGMD
jgi:predicted ferric reductase